MHDTLAKPRPLAVDLAAHAHRVEKPWGWEILWAQTAAYTGKVLHIRAGQRLSLQYHDQKLETLCLVSGQALLVLEDGAGSLQELVMVPAHGYSVHPYQLHRLVALEEAEVYEVSTPETGTTVRVADDYGRPDETAALRRRGDRGWSGPRR